MERAWPKVLNRVSRSVGVTRAESKPEMCRRTTSGDEVDEDMTSFTGVNPYSSCLTGEGLEMGTWYRWYRTWQRSTRTSEISCRGSTVRQKCGNARMMLLV